MASPAHHKALRFRPVAHAVGLLVSLPFLLPVHRLPLPSFESEWLAAVLGVLAVLLLAVISRGQPLHLPKAMLAPLALAAVVLLQIMSGHAAYAINALLVIACLAWSALLAAAGRQLAEGMGQADLFSILAWWMLGAGLIGALFGLMQYMGWATALPWLISPASASGADGIYGNLAQQNHFATQMALALASACCLRASGHLPATAFGALALALLWALAMSGSRSGLLYLAWIAVAWIGCGQGLKSARLWWLLAAFAMLIGALWTGARLGLLGPQLVRLVSFSDGTGPRLWAWMHAWAIFLDHPVLGAGIDRFAYALLGQLQDGEKVWAIDQYAHNLGLQLLAATGLAGFAAVALPLAGLARRIAAAARASEHLWGWSMLGILFIHSMLEQPLYYTYFLAIAALAAGAMDRTAWTVRMRPAACGALIAVLAVALAGLAKTALDYQILAVHFYSEQRGNTQDAQHQAWLADLHRGSLFAPLAELIAPHSIVAPDAPARDKLALNVRLLHYAPIPEVAFRHAALLAEDGQVDAAKAQFRRAARAYPLDSAAYLERLEALAHSDPGMFGALAADARLYLMKSN